MFEQLPTACLSRARCLRGTDQVKLQLPYDMRTIMTDVEGSCDSSWRPTFGLALRHRRASRIDQDLYHNPRTQFHTHHGSSTICHARLLSCSPFPLCGPSYRSCCCQKRLRQRPRSLGSQQRHPMVTISPCQCHFNWIAIDILSLQDHRLCRYHHSRRLVPLARLVQR
jgi:hypothetical protein